MTDLLTPSNITFTLGLLAILFSIYNSFRKPQVDADKKDALLAQQVQWTSDGLERRFKEVQDNFKELLLQSNNHIHTVDTNVISLTELVNQMGKDIVKLSTIIDERIPKKQQ